MDGEEQPETFEKRTPILPDEKFVQEKQKKITKKYQLKLTRNHQMMQELQKEMKRKKI